MKRILPYLALLPVFLLLALFEADYLWTAQEHNLFLHTPLFFQQCMQVSGGLLSWAGTYLTQFFYYPMLGAGLLCLLWAFLMVLLKQAFHIRTRWLWLTLIPVGMLLLANVELGYWIYFLKLRGHLFVASLGIIATTLLYWAFRKIRNAPLISILFPLSTFLFYPLFGFYALLATLLMGISASKARHYPSMFVALGSIILVPLLYYYALYYQTPTVNIYWTALPIFVHNGVNDRWLNLPYVVIVLWLVAAAWRPRIRCIRPWMEATVAAAVLLAVAIGWYKDDNFHRQLTMRHQMEQQDWEGMLSTISDAKGEPTRAISMMKNLALQRLARLSTDLNSYPDGFARPNASFPVHSVHTIGKMLYLQYGIPNYCYRWCMEDGVEYGWSTEQLKLMAKCSLLNREMTAAQRYLSLLKMTDFHREWAKHYEAYLHQPSLVAKDAEFQAIFPLMRDDDFLTSDQSQLEPFLIEHLASMTGTTPEQQELRSVYFKFYLKRNRYIEQ